MSRVGWQGQESYHGLIGGSSPDPKLLGLSFYPEVTEFQMRERVTARIRWVDLCMHSVRFHGVI